MKSLIYKSIVVIFLVLFTSCNEDSVSAAAKGFAGRWEVDIYNSTTSTDIEVSDGGMRFLDTYYSGSYNSDEFTGSYQHDTHTKFTLYITLNGDRIQGTIRTTMYVGSKTYSESEHFTGKRE